MTLFIWICLYLVYLSGVSSIGVTYVTQTSIDRYWMLSDICARWQGPITVAVFVPSTDRTTPLLQKGPRGCDIGDQFRQVIHPAKNAEEVADYPVNMLRNLAVSLVTTSHFLVVDIDFWPSSNLKAEIQGIWWQLVSDPSMAIVVPAFARDG